MSEPRDSGFDLTEGLRDGPHLPAHIYVHVPFCRMKCSYCDFFSVDDLDDQTIEAVLRGIEGQIGQVADVGLPGVVETLYVGGGTPTVIAGGAVRIVREVLESFPVRTGAEVTVEANPDSVTDTLAHALAAAGATRMSVGVQSFVDGEIALLGRVHTVDEAIEACAAVGKAGLGLSLDLMCGIPGQTMASWQYSLERAVETGAQHVSVYPLTLEEGTPLEVAVSTGLVAEPDPDLAAEQMLMAEEFLSNADIIRYEVSNYAVPGHESRHNTAYWTGRSYLALGPGAHGMLDAATAGALGMPGTTVGAGGDGAASSEAPERAARVRYANPEDVTGWLTMAPVEVELLTAEEAAREDVMLGLRLVRGVPHEAVLEAGVESVLADLERDGLVERVTASGMPVLDDGVVPSMIWKTTRTGWLLGNEVFSRVWAGA